MFVFSKGKPEHYHLICDKPNNYAGQTNWGKKTHYDVTGNLKGTDKIKPIPEVSPRYNIWSYSTGFNDKTNDPAVFLKSSHRTALYPGVTREMLYLTLLWYLVPQGKWHFAQIENL